MPVTLRGKRISRDLNNWGEDLHSLLSSANKPPLVKQLFIKLMKMFCITKNR